MPVHSPGPWVIDHGAIDSPENQAQELLANQGTEKEWVAVGVADAEGYAESIAYCHPDNAPVISSSPDMLAALRRALPWMLLLGDKIGNGTPADPMGRCDAVLAMREAIAKAEKQTGGRSTTVPPAPPATAPRNYCVRCCGTKPEGRWCPTCGMTLTIQP